MLLARNENSCDQGSHFLKGAPPPQPPLSVYIGENPPNFPAQDACYNELSQFKVNGIAFALMHYSRSILGKIRVGFYRDRINIT